MMDFLLGSSIWVYLFIFFGKILEVSVATTRSMLINRGERVKGSLLAILEITLWIMVTGTVLAGFTKDIIKIVIFVAAFALGNYFGSWLESKLAFGMTSIQVVVPEEICWEDMVSALREKGFGVTVLSGEGKDGERKILMMHLRRKRIPQAVRLVRSFSKDVFITMNNTKVVCGGHLTKK
jgi:uncharacterized protein YebE (UPF0316 family)